MSLRDPSPWSSPPHTPAIAVLEAHATRLRAGIEYRAAEIERLETALETERRAEQIAVAELVRIEATIVYLQALA